MAPQLSGAADGLSSSNATNALSHQGPQGPPGLAIEETGSNDSVVIIASVFISLSWFTILLRLWTRLITIKNWGWDDTVTVIAAVSSSKTLHHLSRLSKTGILHRNVRRKHTDWTSCQLSWRSEPGWAGIGLCGNADDLESAFCGKQLNPYSGFSLPNIFTSQRCRSWKWLLAFSFLDSLSRHGKDGSSLWSLELLPSTQLHTCFSTYSNAEPFDILVNIWQEKGRINASRPRLYLGWHMPSLLYQLDLIGHWWPCHYGLLRGAQWLEKKNLFLHSSSF